MTRSAAWTARAAALLGRAGRPAASLTAAVLLAAGCSSPHPPGAAGSGSRPATSRPPHIRQYLPHPAGTAPTRTASPASRSPSAVGGASGPPTAPVTEPAAAGPVACAASSLRVTVGPPDSAAGSSYYPLDFPTVSQQSCTLYGFPAVWFAASDGGTTIGQGAVRNRAFAPSLATLTAGTTVHADLQVQVAQSYPASVCKPVTAHWLKVYPPASYVPVYVSFTAMTCTGHIPSGSTLGIYVIRPGVTGP